MSAKWTSPGVTATGGGGSELSRQSGRLVFRGALPGRCDVAFTLMELLIVIAIIGIVAAMAIPAFKNFQKSDAEAAATRQLQDDLARARQFAISRRTTVYMVFAPSNFWNFPGFSTAFNGFTPDEKEAVTNVLPQQLIGYNFVTLRNVGDQPGVSHPEYLGDWHTLPEGTFIPEWKFDPPTVLTTIQVSPTTNFYIYGFQTNAIPFPTADSTYYMSVPSVAFNYLGQLESARDEEIIPLARGTATPALDVNKQPIFAPPTLTEKPTNNSINAFTLVLVDRLTGRAHVEHK